MPIKRSSLKVKICGLKEPDNIVKIADLAPDYLGFVCYEKSPRFIGDSLRDSDLCCIMQKTKRVGVFVSASLSELKRRKESLGFEFFQLHGTESPKYCEEVKKTLPGIKLIKAFLLDDTFCFEECGDYLDLVDYFLFDTASSLRGGSGKRFCWQRLENYTLEKPFFLSGGLGLENIDEALKLAESMPTLAAIDFNIRLETAPGIKDLNLVRQVLAAVQYAHS